MDAAKVEEENNFSLLMQEQNDLTSKLDKAFDNIMLKPVVYDELEYFSKEKGYPFKKRRSNIGY